MFRKKIKCIKARRKNVGDCRKFFSDQIEGLLDIEIGNYIYENGQHLNLKPFFDMRNGADIYILDEDFAEIDEYNMLDFKKAFHIFGDFELEDKSMIGHYHYEDLLWLIMNFKEEKKYMIKKIDEYIDWKEKYLNEKDKK